MKCPFCANEDTGVKDTRKAEDGRSVRRRRMCPACERRFTTFERYSKLPTKIIKQKDRAEKFKREKIKSGIVKALQKRPFTDQDIEVIVDEIEMRLAEKEREAVTSEEVGVEVLKKLREIDEVGYLRFASVYKGFDSADAFAKELNTNLEKRKP